eukprot:m.384719 g.384719  ORF g.384719 m.384719 type:complete len:196 (+) comp16735_c1_seq29:104-691(+)
MAARYAPKSACTECNYKTTRKNNLKVHLRTHTGEKPFACTDCEYKAARNSRLTAHLRIHTFACTDRSVRKSVLTAHLRTHSGEYFVCAECDYTTTHKESFTRHLRTHSPQASRSGQCTQPTQPDDPSICVVCLDAPTTLTCMPCGHQCLCHGEVCRRAIMNTQLCPMCYHAVGELMEAEAAAAQKRREGKRVYQA